MAEVARLDEEEQAEHEPTSRLHLPYISHISPYTSPISPLYLPSSPCTPAPRQAEHDRRWEDKQLAAGVLQFGEGGRFVLKAQEPLPSVAWMASQLDALRTQARAAELVQTRLRLSLPLARTPCTSSGARCRAGADRDVAGAAQGGGRRGQRELPAAGLGAWGRADAQGRVRVGANPDLNPNPDPDPDPSPIQAHQAKAACMRAQLTAVEGSGRRKRWT